MLRFASATPDIKPSLLGDAVALLIDAHDLRLDEPIRF
jgi:hypothetical protein